MFNLWKQWGTSVRLGFQIRNYRKHNWQYSEQDLGRSVKVTGNPNRAYALLRDIVNESNIRQTVRAQSRFESKPDKRRRRRKEMDWNRYLNGIKRNVKLALEFETKT